MKYLNCDNCTSAEYVSAPYNCPNCGASAYWVDGDSA